MVSQVIESRSASYRRLSPAEWGSICGLPWSELNQRVIGRLFAQNGNGRADDILEGRIATATRINRFLAANDLPYRLQRYWLPEAQWPNRVKCSVQRQGIRIVTLTKS